MIAPEKLGIHWSPHFTNSEKDILHLRTLILILIKKWSRVSMLILIKENEWLNKLIYQNKKDKIE